MNIVAKMNALVLVAGFLAPVSATMVTIQGDKPKFFPDYYWRDYFNDGIPFDALRASDHPKLPVYIGNVPLDDGSVQVGQIYAGFDDMAVVKLGQMIQLNKFIKILCTRSQRNFEWVQTNQTVVLSEITGHLVVGGSEHDAPLYIGRIKLGGLRVGKVSYVSEKKAFRLVVNHMGRVMQFFDYFDILYYRQNTTTEYVVLDDFSVN